MAKQSPKRKRAPQTPKVKTPVVKIDKDSPKCFVIMQFNAYLDEYYREIYSPALMEAGCKPVRADEITRSGQITEQILEATKEATFVLADVTGRNANVFYELGLAQALGKPAIILSQEVAEAPFDIAGLRLTAYDTKRTNWSQNLRESIRASAEEILKNPAIAIPSMFLKLREGLTPTEVTPEQMTQIELTQKVEQLRQEFLQANSQKPEPLVTRPAKRSAISLHEELSRLYKTLDNMDRSQISSLLKKEEKSYLSKHSINTWISVIHNLMNIHDNILVRNEVKAYWVDFQCRNGLD